MVVLSGLADLRRLAGARAGLGGVLVPTMGALHEGHEALIRRGVEAAGGGVCIVSIFVNPTQFDERTDLARYPRMLEADLGVCERGGAGVVFAPRVEDIYPPDDAVPVPPLPAVAREPGLEDAYRPGHFAGVCQVVLRLFGLIGPDAAVFGEKDWQQLQVVRALVEERGLGLRVIGHPTVRGPDGLALSSRNALLSTDDRTRAAAIPRSLEAAARETEPPRAEARMAEVLGGAGLRPEYAVVREARTLMPAGSPVEPGAGRALVAVRVGEIRLIDNAPWPA